jgi:ATP-dependent exoDNAse (exonuclease V) alpha subunit
MSAVRGSPDLIALGKDGRGEDRFTTREMIETEQRLASRASELMAERERHEVSDGRDREALRAREERGLALSGEQRDAFAHVTDGRDLSGVVVGYAGTGKSAMLGVAREAWEARATRFAARRCPASRPRIWKRFGHCVAHHRQPGTWLGQGRDMLTSRDVLVIDEAGMVGTRQMERVLSHAADAGAKVVLVGDPQQLQAIEAGAAFRSIHERHGGVEISEVRRQREAGSRTPRAHLATGRTGECHPCLCEHGMVHVAETREQARGDLIDRWDRDRQASPGQQPHHPHPHQ